MALIDLRNATIRLKDAGSNTLEIKIGEGTFTYSESRQIDMVKSRGKLDTTRENEDETMKVSFSFMWIFLKHDGSEVPSVEDVLKNRLSWASANPDTNAPFCVHIEIEHIPACSGVKKELILLPMFNYTELAHSLQDATVACSGECNAREPIITRST